jgi:hypothetical protein
MVRLRVRTKGSGKQCAMRQLVQTQVEQRLALYVPRAATLYEWQSMKGSDTKKQCIIMLYPTTNQKYRDNRTDT